MNASESKTSSASTDQKTNRSFFSKGAEGNFFRRGGGNESSFFRSSPASRVNGGGVLQTKLTIGQPNDQYEQEADATANKVVQRLAPESLTKKDAGVQTKTSMPVAASFLQTKCADCESEEKLQKKEEDADLSDGELQKKPIFESNAEPPDDENTVHRKCAACEKEETIQEKSASVSQNVAPGIESSLMASKGSGSPLPSSTQKQMESSFGADFSNVRIHTGSNAAQMNKGLHAHAFTHGNDIYFNSGKFDTTSTSGQHLLAHELTHTLQQGGGTSAQRKVQRLPDWVNSAAGWVSDTASDVAGGIADGAEAVGGAVVDGAQWVGGKVADGAEWVGDQVSAAAQWVIDQIRGAISSGTDYLTEKWEDIKKFGRNCFEDLKSGFGNLVHLVTNPLATIMSAFSSMNADLLGGAWSLLKIGANGLWAEVNALVKGILDIGKGIWDTVSGAINGIFDTISGLFDNTAFDLLPDSIKEEARSILNGLRSLWNQVSSFWTGLWQDLTSKVQEILDAVKSFVDNVVDYAIDKVISMVKSLKEVYDFVTKLFADPEGTIRPILEPLAAKLNAESPGRADELGTNLAKENFPGGAGKTAANGAIQRAPSDADNRSTATLDEVIKGISYYVSQAWTSLDIKQLLWDTVVNEFWPPATIKAIYKQFDQLWNDDWATTVDSLYTPRNLFDDFWGCLHDLWSNLLILLDFPLSLWRTLNNVVGLLMGYISIAIILGEAIAGGIAAVEVGVVPGLIAGAAAGLATVAALGEALMASVLLAEGATVVTVLTRLFTAEQECEKRQVDILTSVASFISMAVALTLQVLMSILSELVSLIADFLKGAPKTAPGVPAPGVPAPAPAPAAPAPGLPAPAPVPAAPGVPAPATPVAPVAPAPAAPAPAPAPGGGDVIPFRPRPAPAPVPVTPVAPDVPIPAAAKFEDGVTVVPSGETVQTKRKDQIDPEACEKKKKPCYPESMIYDLSQSGLSRSGQGPTPEDFRTEACALRTASGTTLAKFKSLNIAVGKFLGDNGTVANIADTNIPRRNIHSEDKIFGKAETKFGKGKWQLVSLFSERIPCERCEGNLKGLRLVQGCKVYAIAEFTNAKDIKKSYGDGE